MHVKREREPSRGREGKIINSCIGDLNNLMSPDSREGQADQQDPRIGQDPGGGEQLVTHSRLEKACEDEIYC